MNNFEKCDYWLELSDDDLETARALLKANRLLHCGYFCHQTIEKALKAVIAKQSESIPPPKHDLAKLAVQAELWKVLNEEQKAFLQKIIPLQIEARYPQYKEEIYQKLSAEYCEEILRETEEFQCWIKKRLEK